jgi:hypothetical protein
MEELEDAVGCRGQSSMKMELFMAPNGFQD